MNSHRSPFILATILCLASLVGCSTDDNDPDPMAPPPPPPPGGQSGYNGTWTASLDSTDYPVRGLRFTIANGAFVHGNLDSFWDLHNCPPPTFTDARFTPGSPVLVASDEFSIPGPMVTSPQAVTDLLVQF